MDKEKHFTNIQRRSDNPFLNFYEMDAISHSGADFKYYYVSRRRSEEEVRAKTGGTDPEGILVYALAEEDPGRILMVHQYRYPVNMWMYELPAGLIEPGETPEEAAAREVREETGMVFAHFPGSTGSPLTRPYMLAQGFSDEAGVNVFGTVRGELSRDNLEDSEYIRPFLADRAEAARILREEVTSMRAQLLLTMFVNSDPADPFSFLKI